MDINDFGPFHFEVWGNVADWLMLAATVCTAGFLIATFNSQQVITKIEQANYRHKFLPVFKIVRPTSLSHTVQHIYEIQLLLTENPITYLDYITHDENYQGNWDDIDNPREMYRPTGCLIHLPLKIIDGSNVKYINNNELSIQLFFTDVLGNKYSQSITSNWGNLKTEYPKLVQVVKL